jgi:hypothetical protein
MKTSRRGFLGCCGAVGAGLLTKSVFGEQQPRDVKKFHFSITASTTVQQSAVLQSNVDMELLKAVRDAGVSDIWLTALFAGTWVSPLKDLVAYREKVESLGMTCHLLNMPFGHPGSTLQESWRPAMNVDGQRQTGTSLHDPAMQQNCDALRKLELAKFRRAFLDDDFRLSPAPGVIGGCFCNEHKQAFLKRTGFNDSQWEDLCEAVRKRRLTPQLRTWCDFNCDLLTDCYHVQQKAAPSLALGVMVMYFGAEKAGVRLTDYRGLPMRVGECKFDDGTFDPVKGKTDELFSSLFHRRFVSPELAYSETTAFPDKALSLKNKVAKLAVPTLCDVRNTMFMCDFPKEHWPALAPAMKHHAKIHAKIAGHALRGPLKHFWGEASRYVGNDDPYSLFLAMGVPFEVVEQPDNEGWTFFSDADAEMLVSQRPKAGTWVARPTVAAAESVRRIPETLPEMFKLKHELIKRSPNFPYVENESPVVCAWYPTARAVVLWNLSEQPVNFSVRYGDKRQTVAVAGLDVGIVEDVVVAAG